MNNKLFSAFRSRSFLFLWLGEVFTQIPANLLNFLLILIAFNLTKSNTAVAWVVLSFTLPAVFFGVLAGVYIDRWNKKLVLLNSNISRAACIVLLTLFHESITAIYVLSFVISVITQFFIPAETPIIPLVARKDQLLSANALFGIGIFGSILIAYILSGPLLLYFGIVATLLLLVVLFLLGSVFISLVHVPAAEEKKGFSMHHMRIPFSAVRQEIKEVLRIIRSSRQITTSLLLVALSQILILILAAVAPGYANEVLHITVEQFPLLVITPATFGIIIGAFIIANFIHTKKKDAIITIGLFLSAIVMITLPYGSKIASKQFVTTLNEYLPKVLKISNIDLIIILALLLGIANAFVFVPSNTILQEKTSDEMRGKIYGVLNSVVGIFSFLPILAVGSFSDMIGVGRVLVAIGCSLLVVAFMKIFL